MSNEIKKEKLSDVWDLKDHKGITMTKDNYKLVLEVLENVEINPEDYTFGPAYEIAKKEHKKAIQIIKAKLKELS